MSPTPEIPAPRTMKGQPTQWTAEQIRGIRRAIDHGHTTPSPVQRFLGWQVPKHRMRHVLTAALEGSNTILASNVAPPLDGNWTKEQSAELLRAALLGFRSPLEITGLLRNGWEAITADIIQSQVRLLNFDESVVDPHTQPESKLSEVQRMEKAGFTTPWKIRKALGPLWETVPTAEIELLLREARGEGKSVLGVRKESPSKELSQPKKRPAMSPAHQGNTTQAKTSEMPPLVCDVRVNSKHIVVAVKQVLTTLTYIMKRSGPSSLVLSRIPKLKAPSGISISDAELLALTPVELFPSWDQAISLPHPVTEEPPMLVRQMGLTMYWYTRDFSL